MLFTRSKTNSGSQKVTEIAVDSIALNPHQPRQKFDEGSLAELARSVKEHGVIQPIIVRPAGNAFELVAGERRLRAARLAGLAKIPAIVRDVGPQEMAVLALIENLQREDLNVIEEARSYRRLLDEFKFTQSEVGRLVGKGQSTISNKLRLLRLPERVQARVLGEGVSERHARALLELPDEASQMKILDEIRDRGLSVRETENRVRALTRPAGSRGAGGAGGPGDRGADAAGLFDHLEAKAPAGRRGSTISQLSQVSDRRAIRAFRDVRLFLNTFRRAVAMLKEAGIRAEMTEEDGPEFLEVKVRIPKTGPAGPAGLQGVRMAGTAGKAGTGEGRTGKGKAGSRTSPGGGGWVRG